MGTLEKTFLPFDLVFLIRFGLQVSKGVVSRSVKGILVKLLLAKKVPD